MFMTIVCVIEVLELYEETAIWMKNHQIKQTMPWQPKRPKPSAFLILSLIFGRALPIQNLVLGTSGLVFCPRIDH